MPVNPEELLPEGWESFSPEAKQHLLDKIKYTWEFHARPDQLEPPGNDWDLWIACAGRGWGKTRVGAEWTKKHLIANPGWRAGIIAPSYGAGRDVCLEGESGLLAVLPPNMIRKYNRSLQQVTLTNGSRAQCFSGNDPERLRGPQHHLLWMDELAAWQYIQETFDMAQMGLRLGPHPRILISTTPKPTPLVIELYKRAEHGDPTVHWVTGSTFDNAGNLAESTLRALKARYAGTHLGRQELYAEIIGDQPGALWTRSLFEDNRVGRDEAHPNAANGLWLPELVRIVIGVDPSITSGKRSNETGIIVAGLGVDGHMYVLDDLSVRHATPDAWADAVISAFRRYHADRVVVEINNGGEMVEYTLHTRDAMLPVKTVYASRGKQTRAEPVSALYEQAKVHHVGGLAELEDQCVGWVPGEGESPDRLDALVWAGTELMLKGGIAEIFTPDINTAGNVPTANGQAPGALWVPSGNGGDGPRYADRFQRGPDATEFHRPASAGNPLARVR